MMLPRIRRLRASLRERPLLPFVWRDIESTFAFLDALQVIG